MKTGVAGTTVDFHTALEATLAKAKVEARMNTIIDTVTWLASFIPDFPNARNIFLWEMPTSVLSKAAKEIIKNHLDAFYYGYIDSRIIDHDGCTFGTIAEHIAQSVELRARAN